ncbi:hypothetical protein ACJX0J_034954, partial [Zea mays]
LTAMHGRKTMDVAFTCLVDGWSISCRNNKKNKQQYGGSDKEATCIIINMKKKSLTLFTSESAGDRFITIFIQQNLLSKGMNLETADIVLLHKSSGSKLMPNN